MGKWDTLHGIVKPGDKVISKTDEYRDVKKGKIYTIKEINGHDGIVFIELVGVWNGYLKDWYTPEETAKILHDREFNNKIKNLLED